MMPIDTARQLQDLLRTAEAFRAATIEHGALMKVPQNLYIDELRALEAALSVVNYVVPVVEGDRREAAVPPVRRIEMVSYETGFARTADPMWRVEVSGICADLETETAANNMRNAILALVLLLTAPAPCLRLLPAPVLPRHGVEGGQ